MNAARGDVAQVVSIVLLVLGVLALVIAAGLLWRPVFRTRASRRWVPLLLAAAGTALILLGRAAW